MSDISPTPVEAPSYHGPAKAGWIILALACIAAAIPFFGFASWLVAGPLLMITFILGIVVISRGGTGMGIGILLATLIAAPIFIFVAPIVMSLLGLAGAGAALQQSMEAASSEVPQNYPEVVIPSSEHATPPLPRPVADSSGSKPVAPPPASRPVPDDEFGKLKLTLQDQSPGIFTLKNGGLVTEGPRGFLASSDKLDLAQRELVQRENYNRERVFAIIATRTGATPEEVAAKFTEMAARMHGARPAAQGSQP